MARSNSKVAKQKATRSRKAPRRTPSPTEASSSNGSTDAAKQPAPPPAASGSPNVPTTPVPGERPSNLDASTVATTLEAPMTAQRQVAESTGHNDGTRAPGEPEPQAKAPPAAPPPPPFTASPKPSREEPEELQTPADLPMVTLEHEATPFTPSTDADAAQRRVEPLLLEVAWEAVNQVGGIYTVLRSKVPSMVSRWGNRYCLIGPYIHGKAQVEFEPAPMVGPIGAAVKAMNELGFQAHFGRWLVTGRPHAVLLDLGAAWRKLDEIKYRLWVDHHIPSHYDELCHNVFAFGESVRLFLTLLGQAEGHRRQIVAHFHEWMAGVAIPMLRKDGWPGSTVFTTHATLLGRYLAMHNPVFYDHLPFFNPDTEAHHFNIEPQHHIERAAAHGSQVFTTVSDITALECKHLLGREPDMILPNGLNIERFAAVHEFQNLHNEYKREIHEFTMGHFFPSYHFDLDKTLYFFTSGRYEYRNKGMDLTIEALARLNYRLREAGTPVNVVFFIITKAPFKSINVGALQSRAMLREFHAAAEAMKEQIGDRLFHEAAKGSIPDLNSLVEDYWRLRLRRTIHAWTRDSLPAIVTHDLYDDYKDEVLNQLRACNLINYEGDPVKVVFHPDFIAATNPLFGIDYDQFVRGCHLGVFPSYYEPWGYTPLEAIALGVPAITSDLSGFGSYLKQLLPDHDQKGLWVVHRRKTDFNRAADELADHMFRYCQLSRRERITLRNTVEAFSTHFDWHNLGRRYHEAHELALDRALAAR